MHTVRMACGLLASLFATAAPAQESLAVRALRDWYSGISVDGQTERGIPFRAYHNPDGSISALLDGKHKNSGKWRLVEPGHVCVTWTDSSWGTDRCFIVFTDGDFWKLVRVDDPKVFIRLKRVEGNAFGL